MERTTLQTARGSSGSCWQCVLPEMGGWTRSSWRSSPSGTGCGSGSRCPWQPRSGSPLFHLQMEAEKRWFNYRSKWGWWYDQDINSRNLFLSETLRTAYMSVCIMGTHCTGQSFWRRTELRKAQSPQRRRSGWPRRLFPESLRRNPGRRSQRTQTASSSGEGKGRIQAVTRNKGQKIRNCS